MTDNAANSKRIAKNTAMLYVRMFVLMIVSLYTSRVVLNALGVEDFGIYNVVAGFVSILAFFTSSLSNASQRYLSIGLGKDDIEATRVAFRQSHSLMLLFSAGALVLGETVGLWFVCNKLVIPPSRLTAALWIFQFALVSTVCSVVQVSFTAAIVAREKMGMYAYLGIFEAVARLAIAFALQWAASVDHLILYGCLTALVSVITLAFHMVYCYRQFPETSCRTCWRKKLVKEMGAFISANLFGCFAWSAGVQGTNVILNLFFGPVVNAARGIAVQVNSVVVRFTENVMTAMKPQIIKSYASGDMDYMKMLILRSSKYMALLAAFIAMPIMFEARFVLGIWLGQVPDYTVAFVRLVLIEQLISVLVPPLWIAANATGDIKRNQVYGRMFTLAALPVSYVLLLVVRNPMVPMVVLIASTFCYWLYNLYDIKRQIGLDVPDYFRSAIRPLAVFVALLAATCTVPVLICGDDSLLRFVLEAVATVAAAVASLFVVFDRNERAFFKRTIKKRL